jgi:hypothetical protein
LIFRGNYNETNWRLLISSKRGRRK